mmetsp:Transcript_4938/g.8437  ORF Transcript_4938/g.8437 Transcript_4938/m.8437 type:complete len:121 (+) Transcript_4938:363-725(+)
MDLLNTDALEEDGVFIYGFFLEGASWHDKGFLTELKQGVLVSQLPGVKLTPVDNSQSKEREGSHEEGYWCPVYRNSSRRGALTTTGHSSNFLMSMELPRGQRDANHWCKRGVALLMSVEY